MQNKTHKRRVYFSSNNQIKHSIEKFHNMLTASKSLEIGI